MQREARVDSAWGDRLQAGVNSSSWQKRNEAKREDVRDREEGLERRSGRQYRRERGRGCSSESARGGKAWADGRGNCETKGWDEGDCKAVARGSRRECRRERGGGEGRVEQGR